MAPIDIIYVAVVNVDVDVHKKVECCRKEPL